MGGKTEYNCEYQYEYDYESTIRTGGRWIVVLFDSAPTLVLIVLELVLLRWIAWRWVSFDLRHFYRAIKWCLLEAIRCRSRILDTTYGDRPDSRLPLPKKKRGHYEGGLAELRVAARREVGFCPRARESDHNRRLRCRQHRRLFQEPDQTSPGAASPRSRPEQAPSLFDCWNWRLGVHAIMR